MTVGRACEKVWAAEIVRNPSGATSTATGTARARIGSPRVWFKLAVSWKDNAGSRPAAFTGNTFDVFQLEAVDAQGTLARLSDTPINNDGAGAQDAPDGIEGRTFAAGYEVELSATGISGSSGQWNVVLTVTPAEPMSAAEFEAICTGMGIDADTVKVLS